MTWITPLARSISFPLNCASLERILLYCRKSGVSTIPCISCCTEIYTASMHNPCEVCLRFRIPIRLNRESANSSPEISPRLKLFASLLRLLVDFRMIGVRRNTKSLLFGKSNCWRNQQNELIGAIVRNDEFAKLTFQFSPTTIPYILPSTIQPFRPARAIQSSSGASIGR